MFRAICALATATVLCGCSPEPVHAVTLVVLAGQSNAVGYRLEAEQLPPAWRSADRRVQIWTGKAFEPLVPGRNTGTARQPATWGPEVGFAHAWLQQNPEGALYIVKTARGSSSLASAAGLDWAPASGELFAETARAVEAARAALGSGAEAPPVAGVLWLQGEADAVDAAAAEAYEVNLRGFLASVRRSWANDEVPVVLARIPRFGARADEVRAAQAAVDRADPRTISVEAADLPLQPDGLHLSAEGQVQLGRRLADGLKDVLAQP